jgi:flagellin
MALTIGTNVASLQASAAASSVNRDLETSMARLSTGKRINSAADDAAGVAIASRLSSEIRGTDQAIRNALDGQALIDTAEGGHKEIEAILQRMREVAVQSANDTNSLDDRSNLEQEMTALRSEINRIAGVTTWAGNSVMDGGTGGTTKTFSLQVGAATGTKNQISVAIGAMDSTTLGLTAAKTHTATDVTATTELTKSTNDFTVSADATEFSVIDFATDLGNVTITATQVGGVNAAAFELVAADLILKINANSTLAAAGITAKTFDAATSDGKLTIEYASYDSPKVASDHTRLDESQANGDTNAKNAIAKIDAAIKTVNTQRSSLGAVSNRLSHTVSNMTNISTNLSAARGGIEDADFALETTNLAKNQILQQASTAMLAQANASKRNVLSLLQN